MRFVLSKESDDPWYIAEKKEKGSSKSDRRKDSMDPINDMKHFLATKKKCVEEPSSQPTRVFCSPISQVQEQHLQKPIPQNAMDVCGTKRHSPNQRTAKKHSHKKHKHKSKKREAEKEAALEKLRKERLKREESEKVKTEALLWQHYGITEDSAAGPSSSEPSHARPRK